MSIATPRAVRFALSAVALPFFASGTLGAQSGADSDEEVGIVPISDYAGAFGGRRFLLGELGGKRGEWAREGVTFDWSITQIPQSVVDGGRREDDHYGVKSDALFTLDLERLAGLAGGLVTMRVESRAGDSANTSSGAFLPVNDVMFFPQPPDDDFAAYVTELRYTQFLSESVGVFLGKLTTLGGDLNEFAGGRGDTQFLSFNGHSTPALFGPYSALGTGLTWKASDALTLSTSLVASEDSASTTGVHTLDEGLIWSLVAGAQYRVGELPGGSRSTFQYAFANEFVDFNGNFLTPEGVQLPLTDDSWCFIQNFWQYLATEEPATKPVNLADGRQDLEGVGFFFRGGFADRDTNPVNWGVSGGLAGKGLVSGREADTCGVGYAFCNVRDEPFITGNVLDEDARRLETYYSFALTPAIDLSLHYNLANPLLSIHDTASIVSLRLRFNL